VSLRYIANQPHGDPCWRAVFSPAEREECSVGHLVDPCPRTANDPSLAVHGVAFMVPTRAVRAGDRGHVEGVGRLEWAPTHDARRLELRVVSA
jgi:hypothetical protein